MHSAECGWSSCERFDTLVGHHDLHVRSDLFSGFGILPKVDLSNCHVRHTKGMAKNYIKKFKEFTDAWVFS